jgi:SAM-dependent methyltransferase
MNAMQTKWPKKFPPLTSEQTDINDDFMKHWHEILSNQSRYDLIEKFNHGYPIKHAPQNFITTLEIGAGMGEHLNYENLSPHQKKHYVALELRDNMAAHIKSHFSDITTHVGDCQKRLEFSDNHFDRILAIHVLEHLPNLPAAVKEMHRLCHKQQGIFSIVIPCEGGLMYSLARKISAQRIFEKRYNRPYQWFIEREHVNKPHEILEEISPYFTISQKSYFPFIIPSINLNLCIGMTLRPRE